MALTLTNPRGSRCWTLGGDLNALWGVFCLDSCGHLIIPAEYVMTSRVYVFMAWILFIAFIWVLKTCLIFWRHLAVAEICIVIIGHIGLWETQVFVVILYVCCSFPLQIHPFSLHQRSCLCTHSAEQHHHAASFTIPLYLFFSFSFFPFLLFF